MAYNITGAAGNDTLNQAGDSGPRSTTLAWLVTTPFSREQGAHRFLATRATTLSSCRPAIPAQ
jgi:hypothetical protein